MFYANGVHVFFIVGTSTRHRIKTDAPYATSHYPQFSVPRHSHSHPLWMASSGIYPHGTITCFDASHRDVDRRWPGLQGSWQTVDAMFGWSLSKGSPVEEEGFFQDALCASASLPAHLSLKLSIPLFSFTSTNLGPLPLADFSAFVQLLSCLFRVPLCFGQNHLELHIPYSIFHVPYFSSLSGSRLMGMSERCLYPSKRVWFFSLMRDCDSLEWLWWYWKLDGMCWHD